MKNKKTIIYLGFNGFPFGFAPGERQKLIAKSLVEGGYRCIIVARKGTHDPGSIHLKWKGSIENIDYIFTSGSAYKPKSFLTRNSLKIVGGLGEFFYLIALRLRGSIDFGIVYSRNFHLLKYYAFLSKILGFKIILDYTELASAWSETSAQDDFKEFETFEKLSPDYIHGALCISNYLQQFVSKIRPTLPILKVPAICDLEKISSNQITTDHKNYFLFCGTLFYMEIIKFIIQSFEEASCSDVQLFLIVNGNDKENQNLQLLIAKSPKGHLIKTFNQLNYYDLIGLYKRAEALLIPLRPTIQDIARFPHKIGEYTSSGRPIITTNYGEIQQYFVNEDNALIADHYGVDEFRKKMEFVVSHPEKATQIGLNGKNVAANYFDYHAIGKQLIPFLKKV